MSNHTRNILYGALACSPVSCSDPWVLADILSSYSTQGEGAGDLVKRMLEKLSPTCALTTLVIEDLRVVVAHNMSMLQYSENDLHADIDEAFHCSLRVCENAGLMIPLKIKYHIVDEFPGPYAKQEFWALSLDASDAKECGCEPGIFLRSNLLFPGVSALTLCHELTHSVLSLMPSEPLVRGLEEGICDIVGSLLCAARIGGEKTLCALINTRFPNDDEKIDAMYIDHLHQAGGLLNLFGIKAVLAIVRSVQNSGREILYKIEDAMISRDYYTFSNTIRECIQQDSLVGIDGKGYEKFSENLAIELLSYSKSYTLSPEAVLLSRVVSINKTIEEAIECSPMKNILRPESADELRGLYLILENDDNKLISNECPRYIRKPNYRYMISTEDKEILLSAL